MVKNRCLAKAISEQGWGEFRRQLGYKCEWYGSTLISAPQFFASSKLCSKCGTKKKTLTLADRTYRCDACGLEIDRDLNAAINLAQYGTGQTTGNAPGSYTPAEKTALPHLSPLVLSAPVEEGERNQLRRTRKEAKEVPSGASGTFSSVSSTWGDGQSTLNPCVVGGDGA